MLSLAFHAVVVCLVCAGLVLACRWVNRRATLAGQVLVAGLLIRTCGALFFFWTSFLGLPFLRKLQMGNGFWWLAPDAEEYYRLIGEAATHWHFWDPDSRSPGYVLTVALWMRGVGLNPAGVLFFNLALYVASAVAIVAAFGRVRDRRAQWAAAAAVGALSFSPMMIFTTVQGLKDVFVVALVVAVAVAHVTLLSSAWTRATLKANLFAVVVAAVAVWLLAATRTYFAILIWAATALAYLARLVAGGRSAWRPCLVQSAAVLPVLALVVLVGGSPQYFRLATQAVVGLTDMARTASSGPAPGPPSATARAKRPLAPFDLGLQELDAHRRGFNTSGGESTFARATETRPPSRLQALAIGLAATFIPMSILQHFSLLAMPSRTGLLPLADADTLFLDLTVAIAIWILIRNRKHIDPAYAVFLVALAMLTMLPMAYVVTNFGTLVRLRLMTAAPIWLLPLALASWARRAGRDGP